MRRALAIVATLAVLAGGYVCATWLGLAVVVAFLLGSGLAGALGLVLGFLGACWLAAEGKKAAPKPEPRRVEVAPEPAAGKRVEPGSPADLLDAAVMAAMAIPPLMRPTFVMRIIERWEIALNSEGRIIMPRHIAGRGN